MNEGRSKKYANNQTFLSKGVQAKAVYLSFDQKPISSFIVSQIQKDLKSSVGKLTFLKC